MLLIFRNKKEQEQKSAKNDFRSQQYLERIFIIQERLHFIGVRMISNLWVTKMRATWADLPLSGVHKRHEKSTEYAFEPRKQAGLVRTPWNELSEYVFKLRKCAFQISFFSWAIAVNPTSFAIWLSISLVPARKLLKPLLFVLLFPSLKLMIFFACLSKISQISGFFLLSKTSDESLCSELGSFLRCDFSSFITSTNTYHRSDNSSKSKRYFSFLNPRIHLFSVFW